RGGKQHQCPASGRRRVERTNHEAGERAQQDDEPDQGPVPADDLDGPGQVRRLLAHLASALLSGPRPAWSVVRNMLRPEVGGDQQEPNAGDAGYRSYRWERRGPNLTHATMAM